MPPSKLELMALAQVRRLPIVVRDNQLIGMLAQADAVRTVREKLIGEVVEQMSQPPRGLRVIGRDLASRLQSNRQPR